MMKKALSILGIVLLTVVILLFTGFLIVTARGIPKYDVPQIEYRATITPQAVARGKKLTLTLCANCHRNPETGKLTGYRMLDAPPEFGNIYSRNITQDTEHGIGEWTDAELLVLLRTGIKRDGQYIPPYMAKLPHLADEDVNAIIAFLRSDDPLVAADPTPDRDSEVTFLTKMLSYTVWKPATMPDGPIAMPDTTDEVALGKYLAINFDCWQCHSASFTTNNLMEPEQSPGFFGGGNKLLNKEGQLILAPNITPHETGIGNMTKEAFTRLLIYGEKKDAPGMRYPMEPYPLLTVKEAEAIYAYLQTVDPIDNKVERLFYD